MTSNRHGVLVACAIWIAVGCGWQADPSSQDARDIDMLVVQAIERADSPIVAAVRYNEADYVDEATIDVELRGEPSSAEIQDLVCRIIVPVLRQHHARESLGISIWDGHKPVPRLVGTELMDCEAG